MTLILEAKQGGCRLEPACHEVQADKRPICLRPEPANKLSQEERDAIIEVCNRSEFASLPPTQIVPTLLDRGEYIASESSFCRVLSTQGQLHKRGRQRTRQKQAKPTSYTATDSN
ncbi:hypothetical protein BCU17_14125 [Vibrio splendidus]|uniref:Transposase n=1 Tax=Vibrio splendidus TaxID=29497 RepID=A0A2N7FIR6_VIBSP|nr:hypothetical protein BCU17_14125 [Vibrio splendidus]